MKFYVYVIASKKKNVKTYVGWTTNLKTRLKKHNSGKGAKSTRGRRWEIVYSEVFINKIQAMKREYVLKKDKKFRLKLKNNL